MGTILEEIKYYELRFEEIVGRGSFGVVYRAKWKGQVVAVKRAETETEIQSFRIEAQQLKRVSHPNVITIFGICSDDTTNPLCLVMEYAECGSLYQLLHGCEDAPQYSLAHGISWLVQCARGVACLHAMKPKPLIHRDLKPPNILLSDFGRICKLCDFGTACEARTYLTNNRGSAAWMAPEVFESNKYTEKCDVFSFGIIIWEVITRKRPYDEIGGNIYRIMWAIHRGIRPPLIRGCPAILETLMTKCWAKEPQDRPKMTYVVKTLERVSAFLKGASQPIRWKKTSKDLSHARAIQEHSAANSLENEYSGSKANTVVHSPEQEKSKAQVSSAASPDQAYHTNTLTILPVVEAEAEPYVRYTTLHEHNREPAIEEEDDFPRYNYSSTLKFGSAGSLSQIDHGFEDSTSFQQKPTGMPVQRPVTLDFIRTPSTGMRLSFNPINPNFHIDVRSSPAVRRVQSLTFEMSSPTVTSTTTTTTTAPTTTFYQRHYSFRSDPDEYSYTEDATDDDDTCHSDTFPTHVHSFIG